MLQAYGAPPIELPRVKPGAQRATVATTEELGRLVTTAKPHMRLFILLYFQCGLRLSEALRVTPRSWNPETHTVTVQTKGGNIRAAEVTAEVERLFEAARPWEGRDTENFITLLAGTPQSARSMSANWKRHRIACNISPEVTAHDLRRTAASILYAATKDLRVPQQLLGHKNLASTLRYLAPLAPDEARRYAELLRFDKFTSEVKQ